MQIRDNNITKDEKKRTVTDNKKKVVQSTFQFEALACDQCINLVKKPVFARREGQSILKV